MAIERDVEKKLTVGSVKAAKQAEVKLKETKAPKIVKPVKPVPFKSTAKKHQALTDVTTGMKPTGKLGDIKKPKLIQKYAPVNYQIDEATGETKTTPRYTFRSDEQVPDTWQAKKLFDTINGAKPEKARSNYSRMTERGKKTFWSYVLAKGLIDQTRLTEDMKNDMKLYGGAEYFKDQKKTALLKEKTAELAKLKETATSLRPKTNEQLLSEKGISPERVADYKGVQPTVPTPPSPGILPSGKVDLSQYTDITGKQGAYTPLPTTGIGKAGLGLVSGATANLNLANMTPEERAKVQAMRGVPQKRVVTLRDGTQRVVSEPQLTPYNVGEFVGGTATSLTGEGAIANLAKVGAKEIAKKGIIAGAVGSGMQGVQSATEGKNAKQIATDMALAFGFNTLADVGLNKLINSIGKKYANQVITPEVEQAIKTETEQAVKSYRSRGGLGTDIKKPTIQTELGLKRGTSAEEALKMSEQIAKEIESERYYKQFEPKKIGKLGTIERISDIQKIPRKPVTGEYIPNSRIGKTKPSTIASEPSKPTVGSETLPKIEKPATGTTETITNIDDAIKLTKSKISTAPLSSKKTFGERIADGYQGIVSTNAPIEKIGRLKIQGAKKFAQQAQNLGQTSGTVDYVIGKKLVNLEGDEIGKGIDETLKGLSSNEQSDLWDMVLNRHNIDRMAQGKPVFGDEITAEMSDAIVKKYESNPKLVEAEKNIRKIIDTVTDEFAVKTGLVNKKVIDDLRLNVYKAYFPTNREMDKVANQLLGNAGGKILKKATGSSRQIIPPEQQLAAYVNKVVRAGRKNEMYNGLLDLVMKNPDELAPFAQLSKTAEARIKPDTGDLLNDAIDSMETNAVKVGDRYQFTLYKDGDPVTLNVSESMYKALNNATDDSLLAEIGDVFRKYATGPMKALTTGYNPLFAVTNFMRDLPTALLYSTDAPRWIKNYPKAMKEIASNGELWKQYQALGGTRSGLFSYEKGVSLPSNRNLAQKIRKGALDAVGSIGNITEVLPRFTEYLATIEKMGNNLDGRIAGIANAAEITTNFARSGKLTKQADAFIPYLNPAVQGIDRFYRAVRYNPIKTIAKGVGLITVPAMILESMNSKDPAFKEMNQRTKDAFYLVPMGEGKYFKVPKSRENALVFATLFEWLARAKNVEKIDIDQSLNTIWTNFSPGDPVNSFVGTPLIKALAQIKDPKSAVKNYANMDIVPQNLRGVDAKYQYDVTTRQLSKAVGEQLNVSPKVIDYLIDSYTGVIGQATRPSTTKTGLFSTIGNKFIADAASQNDNINKLYNLSDKLTTKANTRNLVEKIPSKTLTPEEAKKSAVNKQLQLISDLRKKQKAVESENLTLEQKKAKVREIQMQMNKIAGDALNKYSKP